MKKYSKILNLFYKFAASKGIQCEKCKSIDPYADAAAEFECWKCGHKNKKHDKNSIKLKDLPNKILEIIDQIIYELDIGTFARLSTAEISNKTVEEFKSEIKNDTGWDTICEYIPLNEEFIEYFKDDVDWWWIFEQQDSLLNKNFINKYKDRFLAAGVDKDQLS